MSESVAYNQPPIREAVFDLRVHYATTPELGVFDVMHEELKADYPSREVVHKQFFSFMVGVGSDPKLDTGGGPNGVRLTSVDKTKIVQFRDDGMTFSMLKPYKNWEEFIAEAKRLLTVYFEKSKPEYVERIALRYINAIEIPEQKFDLEEYFLTHPRIGEKLPQQIVEFFSRVFIKDDKSDGLGIINQTIEKTDRPEITTVLLDIDVFHQGIRAALDSEEIWSRVDLLKEFRTRVFEGSITDKTRKLFN